MSLAVGFLLGWFTYHLLMNRAVMMRECCVKHFSTHNVCPCRDCRNEWKKGLGPEKASSEKEVKSETSRGEEHPSVAGGSAAAAVV